MCLVSNTSAWLEALAQHAAKRPHAIAVQDVSPHGHITQTTTWQELVVGAQTRANLLVIAAPPGSAILTALTSGTELAIWFAGAIAAGVRLVMMHPKSGPSECAAVCERTNIKAALASAQILTKLRVKVTSIDCHPLAQPLDYPSNHVSGLLQQPHSPGAIVLGSSGTTGLPKLVLRESPALDADARAVKVGLSLSKDDCVLCIPPLSHSYGVDLLLGTLFAGATLRIMTDFDPCGVVHQLANGITVLPGVPFVYESLARLAASDLENPPIHGLRLAISAGSPLTARVRKEFTDHWNIPIGQLYGATELGTVSVSTPGEPGFDVETIGAPLPGVSFRVLDVDDPSRLLSPGEIGQLAVRAPSMLSGYIDGDLELIDGHLLTGDLARQDDRGQTTLTGRLKLLIDIGGFKVNPLEVETTLLEHPEVAQCAVLPLELSDTIHRLSALVVARDPAKPPVASELRRFMRERLAPIKIPRNFEIVDSLPRSALGKLLRDHLIKGKI